MKRSESQLSASYHPSVPHASHTIIDTPCALGETLCGKGTEARGNLIELVRCSAALLSDISNLVREAALASMDGLSGLLTPSEQEQHLVPVITDLLSSDDRMDRVCGLLLLVSLIEKGMRLGGESRLVNWLSLLLCDDDDDVRQVKTKSLLPLLECLSRNWHRYIRHSSKRSLCHPE